MRQAFGARLESEMAALMQAAATDLRANTLKATREEAQAALAKEGVAARADAALPAGPAGGADGRRSPACNASRPG